MPPLLTVAERIVLLPGVDVGGISACIRRRSEEEGVQRGAGPVDDGPGVAAVHRVAHPAALSRNPGTTMTIHVG